MSLRSEIYLNSFRVEVLQDLITLEFILDSDRDLTYSFAVTSEGIIFSFKVKDMSILEVPMLHVFLIKIFG